MHFAPQSLPFSVQKPSQPGVVGAAAGIAGAGWGTEAAGAGAVLVDFFFLDSARAGASAGAASAGVAGTAAAAGSQCGQAWHLHQPHWRSLSSALHHCVHEALVESFARRLGGACETHVPVAVVVAAASRQSVIRSIVATLIPSEVGGHRRCDSQTSFEVSRCRGGKPRLLRRTSPALASQCRV